MIELYIVGINIFAFALFAADKKLASAGQWRIPKRWLLLTALAGGCAGAWLAMLLFRHKTRKPVFFIGIPVIIIAYIGTVVYLRFR